MLAHIEKRGVVMSDFKVVNTRYQFVTKAAIDFVDLTDEVQELWPIQA